MTLNALNQPRSGYIHVTYAKPATRASLSALRDLLLEKNQSDAARAVENAITACHEATANLHAVDLASSIDVDTTAEAREIAGDIATFGILEMADFTIDAQDWQDQISELRGGV